jgi:hypothetical protein
VTCTQLAGKHNLADNRRACQLPTLQPCALTSPATIHQYDPAETHLAPAVVTCAGSTCLSGHCACPNGGQLNTTANCGSCGYVCPSGKCIHLGLECPSGPVSSHHRTHRMLTAMLAHCSLPLVWPRPTPAYHIPCCLLQCEIRILPTQSGPPALVVAGQTCSNGVCCVHCGGSACINLLTDKANCGSCGASCPAPTSLSNVIDVSCYNATCIITKCAPG